MDALAYAAVTAAVGSWPIQRRFPSVSSRRNSRLPRSSFGGPVTLRVDLPRLGRSAANRRETPSGTTRSGVGRPPVGPASALRIAAHTVLHSPSAETSPDGPQKRGNRVIASPRLRQSCQLSPGKRFPAGAPARSAGAPAGLLEDELCPDGNDGADGTETRNGR